MNTKYFEPLKLRAGDGGSYENGLCVMEAVAWLNGEEATDAPECACPVLANFAIRINDRLDDKNRQQLSRLILPLTGSRSEEHERARADYLVIQVTKRIVPMWFDRAGMPEWADKLRQVETIDQVREVALAAKSAAADAAAVAAAVAASYAAAGAYADVAAYAAYAAYAAAGAYADVAAYAADAAAADAAYAVAAAVADAAQPMLIASIDILDEAIKLGPNGYDQWPTYEPRAAELVDFAKTVLVAS